MVKLVIEDEDVTKVQNLIKDYFKVVLTNEQTLMFINNELQLAADAYQFGWMDTEVRDRLTSAFYERLCAKHFEEETDELFEEVKAKAKEFGFQVLE